MLLIKKK